MPRTIVGKRQSVSYRRKSLKEVKVGIITNRGVMVTEELLKDYQIQSPTSKQIQEEKWKPQIIEPPYKLSQLMSWMDVSIPHSSCVHVKSQDSVGIGYDFNYIGEGDIEDPETDESYKILKEFFHHVNPDEDITSVCKKVFIDFEGCGNGYFEVSRDAEGMVNGLYHVNATTVRRAKDKERFIQKVGDSYVWFKKFGDERQLNKETGKWSKDINDPALVANELIPIVSYTWKSATYGLPEWLPSLYAMVGNMKETEYNIDFFTNFGIPAYAVIIEGGALTPEDEEAVVKFFETELKGSNHKTLTFSIPKGATVRFEKLNVDMKEASFMMYRKDNRDDILTAHHVPPYRVGIVEKGQLGGSVAEDTDRIYLDSVINPRQEQFTWVLNELIIKQGLQIEEWEFYFEDINIRDKQKQSVIHQTYFGMGAMTANEIRADLGLDPYEGGDVFYVGAGLIPAGVSFEGITSGRVKPEEEKPEEIGQEAEQVYTEKPEGNEEDEAKDSEAVTVPKANA